MPRLHPAFARREPSDMEEQLKKKEDELKQAEEKLATAQAMLAAAAAHGGKNKRKQDTLNKEMQTLIGELVKTVVWRECKFLTSADQEKIFVNQVIEAMGKTEYDGNEAEAIKKRAEFHVIYSKFCVTTLNGHRNYVQSSMRTKFDKWIDAGKDLPPFGDLLKCAQRNLPVRPDNHNTIIFYADWMMTKFCGDASLYSNKVRYYHPISLATSTLNCSCGPDITPATEAFGLLVLENNYTKWPKLKELTAGLSDAEKERVQVLAKPSTNKSGTAIKKSHHFYVTDHPELGTKYTESSAGQRVYGGWTTRGINRFVQFRKAIKKARNSDEGKKWEAAVLQVMRDANNITEPTYEQQREKDGGRGAKPPPEPAKVVEDLFEDDDTDEEGIGELHEV